MMIKTAETYHVSVLLKESVDGLAIQPGGVYVDVTFGGGGHSREILSRLGGKGRLFGFDQDADAEQNIVADDRFTFVRSNFRYIRNWMRYYGVDQIDGLLADLGVSSHHFDDETRGFSFRFDAPLDMRMNKRAGMTAADVLNTYSEEQLADIFYIYGELKNARKVAATVVKARTQQPVKTTAQLIEVTNGLFAPTVEKKEIMVFTFSVHCPLFIRGQWHRHRTWSYNEISRRYTEIDLEFYTPPKLRRQAENDRQASVDSPEFDDSAMREEIAAHNRKSLELYNSLIARGACREQARGVLPQNMMVTFWGTVDLNNLLHFLELRDSEHAQWEIRQYACAIKKLIKPIIPNVAAYFESRGQVW